MWNNVRRKRTQRLDLATFDLKKPSITFAWDISKDMIMTNKQILSCGHQRYQAQKCESSFISYPLLSKSRKFGMGSVSLDMIFCPSGSFLKGNQEYYDKWKNIMSYVAAPTQTEIKKPFFLSQTEITQELYENVMESNPIVFGGLHPLKPIGNITWYDAIEFCNRLSKMCGLDACYTIEEWGKDGKLRKITKARIKPNTKYLISWDISKIGFRLPTIAEWEYAARANENFKYSGSNDLNEIAWYQDNSNANAQVVATKKPNAWGFYDMTGNVSEWCWTDMPEGSTAPTLGGHYKIESSSSTFLLGCSSAEGRMYTSPTVGLRVAIFQ